MHRLPAGVERRRLSLPGGIEIALLDFGGEGRTALLHHANGLCAATFGPVAEGLRERFHVVAMDARGHGDSSKPESREAYAWAHFGQDLRAVAERLAEERGGPLGLGVGHSFGGTAMLSAGAESPELFARLLLVDPVVPPPLRGEDTAEGRSRVRDIVEGARRRRSSWPSREAARAWWADRPFFAQWDPRALDLYLAEGLAERPDGSVELKCRPEVEAAIFEQGGTADALPRVERVTAPTLILHATRGSFPRAAFDALAARMPRARVEEVDAGHLVPMERPDLVVRFAVSEP